MGGAENGTGFDVESGVAGGESKLGNQNLTSEANGGPTAFEAVDLKEVAACNDVITRGLAELSELHKRGFGTFGAPVAGGGEGRAARDAAINARGPLMRPIS